MSHQDFERYAEQKRFGANMPLNWVEAFQKILTQIKKPSSAISFLDYGCGDGRTYTFLTQQGLMQENIHGVEVSHSRVQRCHDLGWNTARYLEKGMGLPYEDNKFDLINIMEVLEHIPSQETGTLMDEIWRVLNPEGYLMVTTPNYPIKRFYDVYSALVFRKWVALRDDPTHVTFYNHARLGKLLGQYFRTIEEHPFKAGFLFKYVRHPFFLHKMFFLCSGKRKTVE